MADGITQVHAAAPLRNGDCLTALFAVILRLRRRRQALKPAQQILFGHAIELNVSAGFDLSLHIRIDHRRSRFRLRFVDLDVLLKRMDDILAQIARRELAVADLA